MRIATLLFVLALALHAWVGMRDIFMDYVQPLGLRLALHVGCAGLAGELRGMGGCDFVALAMKPVKRKFDAVIVGGGGAGLRAALQLSGSGLEGGGGVQGIPDAFAHGIGPGRHYRRTGQCHAGQLALAHV